MLPEDGEQQRASSSDPLLVPSPTSASCRGTGVTEQLKQVPVNVPELSALLAALVIVTTHLDVNIIILCIACLNELVKLCNEAIKYISKLTGRK